jgi:CheY-like chemotaxis protein
MAMVYGLTKQQQGFVHVESEPGRGTTVRLAFPVVDGPATSVTSEQPVSDASECGGKESILFVDDEEALRRVGQRLLRSHGYAVITANDGVDALEKLESGEFEFDLIITDLMMPNMSGLELCKAIEQKGIVLPIILASGHTDTNIPADTAHRASVSFIRKPWDVKEMLAAVRKVLERK